MTHSHSLTPAMLALLEEQARRHEFEQDMRLQEAVRRLQRRRSNRLRVPLYAGGFGLPAPTWGAVYPMRSAPGVLTHGGRLTDNLAQSADWHTRANLETKLKAFGDIGAALGFGS